MEIKHLVKLINGYSETYDRVFLSVRTQWLVNELALLLADHYSELNETEFINNNTRITIITSNNVYQYIHVPSVLLVL